MWEKFITIRTTTTTAMENKLNLAQPRYSHLKLKLDIQKYSLKPYTHTYTYIVKEETMKIKCQLLAKIESPLADGLTD